MLTDNLWHSCIAFLTLSEHAKYKRCSKFCKSIADAVTPIVATANVTYMSLRRIMEFRPSGINCLNHLNLEDFKCDWSSIKHVTASYLNGIEKLINLESLTIGTRPFFNLSSFAKLTRFDCSKLQAEHVQEQIKRLPHTITDLTFECPYPFNMMDLRHLNLQKLKFEDCDIKFAPGSGSLMSRATHFKSSSFKWLKSIQPPTTSKTELTLTDPDFDALTPLMDRITGDIDLNITTKVDKIPRSLSLFMTGLTAPIDALSFAISMTRLRSLQLTGGTIHITIYCDRSRFALWPDLHSVAVHANAEGMYSVIDTICQSGSINSGPKYQAFGKDFTIVVHDVNHLEEISQYADTCNFTATLP